MYALEEFVFNIDPSASGATCRDIRLPKERFHLQSDQVIALSTSDKGLSVVEENSNVYFHISDKSKSHVNTFSKDVILSLKTRNGENLTMLVFFGSETAMCFYRTERSRVISLGKGLSQNICGIDSELLSDAHMILRRTDKGDRVNVKGSRGCYLNGIFAEPMSTANLNYGDVVIAGGIKLLWLNDYLGIEVLKTVKPTLVRLEEASFPDEMYIAKQDNEYRDNTGSPRNLVVPDESKVKLDPPPQKREIRRQPAYTLVGPALTMAIPMCLGCGLYIYSSHLTTGGAASYMYTGLVTAVSSAILGAMWALINIKNAAKQERKEESLRVSSYKAYIETSDKRIRDKYRYNVSALRRNDPSVPELFSLSSQNVFNRRKNDENLFSYRIGTGNRPFPISIEAPEERFNVIPDELTSLPLMLKNKYSILHDVPICIDIHKNPLSAFLSDNDRELQQLFLNISLQIAATTGPDIVRMVFLFDNPGILNDHMRLLSFLPQVRGEDEHYVSCERDRSRELSCSLETTIRKMEHKDFRWVIFTDDIRQLPISVCRRADVSILIFARGYNGLPGECTLIVQNDDAYRGILNLGSKDSRCEVNFDRIGIEDAFRYIRSIAAMKVRKEVLRGVIPMKVTLPALFEVERITVDFIRNNWIKNDTGNSLMAPVGRSADERNVYLDIHEKAHGPHGLVAGMTGSGKSEMLATFILSLAVRYSPLELGFLLIDYKGGGMAEMFRTLPHLRGSISNLSGNMIKRALVSIRSENERRQKLFLKAGVNSITDYGRLFRSGRVKEALPHIVIIIDEFAELKRNEPDFMKELISVAQVGRSLGVHLILATQKPTGTVDDNIFSNSRFRICLRVQDKQDSNDMLHRPDAAFIKEPGRAFLQVGNDELFDEFQTGYAMEPYEEDGENERKIYLVDEYGHRQEIIDKTEKVNDDDNTAERETHFSMILKSLKECEKKTGKRQPGYLWLPPLCETVLLRESGECESVYDIMLGLYDEPAAQIQGEYHLNLLKSGHQVICGSPLSGKSTLLQTMLYGYIRNCSPRDLNIYIIDYSNGILSSLKDSRLVGIYITEEDEDRLPGLFCMLSDILKKRRREYVGVSFQERRRMSDEAAIMLVIDNYGRFREKTEYEYDRYMLELIKFAEVYGIYVILSGSSIGSNDIPARLFENCKTGICLRMNDKYQYSECLRQVRLPILPDDIKGRGLAVIDGKVLEFQTAICSAKDELERSEYIRNRIDEFNRNCESIRAMRVPFIPKDPTVRDLEDSIDGQDLSGIAIGYEAVSGKPLYIKDNGHGCLVFAGRRGSGRSNAVRVYEHFAKKRGFRVERTEDILGFIRAASTDNTVVILENTADAIEAFYKGNHTNKGEDDFAAILAGNEGNRYVFTLSDKDYARMAGLTIYERIIENCKGIYLGGSLDKQNIFDYSYLSFSELCLAKPRGTGTVLKGRESDYYGDIIIPAA